MRKRQTKSLLLFLLALPLAFAAQNASEKTWISKMHDSKASLYDIQKSYYADPENPYKQGSNAAEAEEEEQGGGWELFKRYEYFAAPRVFPSGDRSQMARTHAEYQSYLQARNNQRGSVNPVITANSWTYFNPTNIPSKGGAGRVNCIAVDPANASNFWLGTPDGGLWQSTNGGTSWTTGTDLFTDLGVSDIAIDPTNSKVMFVASGDRDGFYSGSNHSFSYGIMKSTDGGITWTNVYSFAVSSQAMISRILIDPSNTQNIYAAGSMGIIKSVNGGTTWTTAYTTTDLIWSMEFKPGTSSTLYAAGTGFYMSTNSGTAWTTITSGLPAASAVFRMSVAVSAANPAIVYVLAADAAGTVMNGLYQSTNSGTSFTQKHAGTNPNLLGFSQNGSDGTAGQSFYTLSIGVNPTNANEVMVGGVNIWKSSDGGSTWGSSSITYWAATHTSTNYVHADIHHILYQNGTTVLVGCDGGIFKTANTGTAWSDICTNLQISQPYSLGMSTTNAAKVLSGWQDNGTNLMTTTSTWTSSLGGDGMKCFVDRTNDNVLYGEQYNGSFNRSTNGGTSWSSVGPPSSSESTAWATPWKQDPATANTIYGGMTNLYKSTNQGTSWTVMGTMPDATDYINEFAIAPSNAQVIYVVKNGGVFKTVNGGAAWTTITGTIPATTNAPTYVAVCSTNPNIAYVTVSGYTSGNKVYVTSDGGTTWTNYSTGLPNLPANCITYAPNSHGAVYVGMDVGVYYRDSTLSTWQAYNTGLPNAIVMQMEIYAPTAKLRAATFGRGIWEIPLYVPTAGVAPTATFTPSSTSICAGASVNFTDNSTGVPTSWSWTFPGGTPASSSVQNPSAVVFSTAGTYTVSLTASNTTGSSAPHTQVITVNAKPAVPVVSQSGSVLSTTATGVTYQWSLNGTPISGATAQTYTATVLPGNYTVTVKNPAGCTSSSVPSVVTGVESHAGFTQFTIFPNPNNGTFDLNVSVDDPGTYELKVFDVIGKTVYAETLHDLSGSLHKTISLQNCSAGVYMLSLSNGKYASVRKVVVY